MTETTVTPERPLVVEEGDVKPGFIGQNVPRKEDKRLVQGEGVFFDDVKRHEMGFVHFVRSPYAHARIKSVDVAKALELDGVYGTLTGDEVAILTDPFFELSTPPGANIKDYALAVGKVRHVGDPVAAVVARTRDLARDAAELVEVEYEPLPLVLDGEQALADEVVLHDDAGSNTVWSGTFDWGDFDGAMAHRPAHREHARERAHVPRRHRAREGRRHDARLLREGDRRLRGIPAVRAPRLHHLGAGDAGVLPLAERPGRLHTGLHQQVA